MGGITKYDQELANKFALVNKLYYAIEYATTIEECKQYETEAAAIREAARVMKSDHYFELANKAVLQAQRKVGELLNAVQKAKRGSEKGSNKGTRKTPAPGIFTTAHAAGLSNRKIFEAQQLAKLSKEQLDTILEDNPRITAQAIVDNIIRPLKIKTEEEKDVELILKYKDEILKGGLLIAGGFEGINWVTAKWKHESSPPGLKDVYIKMKALNSQLTRLLGRIHGGEKK